MGFRRRFLSLSFSIRLAVLAGAWAAPQAGAQPDAAEARAAAELKELVTLQNELLDRAAAAEVQEDVEALRPRLQSLVLDFERYLRTYPKRPDGYIAYSLLLGNPLLDERQRAEALLLKANSLDPNLPIVKNQLGKYLAEAGRPLDALNYFLSAVQLAPDEPLYHLQVGQLLGAARDDFLQSGEWTVAQIDAAMEHALAEAVRLQPDSLPYAYRYAEHYYDVAEPDWAAAMEKWRALEARATSDTEKQLMRLHQANVLLYQGQLDAAEVMLAESFAAPLVEQRERLVARLVRLRDPTTTENVAASAVAANAVPAASVPQTPRLAEPLPFGVDVPTFETAATPDALPVTSDTVVALAEANRQAREAEAAPAEETPADSATTEPAPDQASGASPARETPIAPPTP